MADALAREIAHYRAHHLEGHDRRSLEGLRARCTEVLRAGLGPLPRTAPAAELQEALLASLRFARLPRCRAARWRACASTGVRLVVVSNWDCSLPGVLERAGLGELVDATVTSGELRRGQARPGGVRASAGGGGSGARATRCTWVTRCSEDVEGARAAGIEAVLVVRARCAPAPAGVRAVRSLAELAAGAA